MNVLEHVAFGHISLNPKIRLFYWMLPEAIKLGRAKNQIYTGDGTTDILDNASDTLDDRADTLDQRGGVIGKWPLPLDCYADRLNSGGRLADGPAGVLDRMSDRRNKQAQPLDEVSHPGGRGVDTLDNRQRRPDGTGRCEVNYRSANSANSL